MSCGYYFIHIYNLLLSLCSGLGVERTKFFTFTFLEKKVKISPAMLPFLIILSLEQQQHTLELVPTLIFLGLGGILVFVCLFSEEKGKLNYLS